MGNCGSCGAVASEADFCTSCRAPLWGTDGESATELLESPTRVGGATGSSSASDEDESTSQTVDASDPDAGPVRVPPSLAQPNGAVVRGRRCGAP